MQAGTGTRIIAADSIHRVEVAVVQTCIGLYVFTKEFRNLITTNGGNTLCFKDSAAGPKPLTRNNEQELLPSLRNSIISPLPLDKVDTMVTHPH